MIPVFGNRTNDLGGQTLTLSDTVSAARYRLGLPAWAFPGWKNRYFADRPSTLASYAQVFATVEGNTTFYRTPDEKTIANWQRAVAETDFRLA